MNSSQNNIKLQQQGQILTALHAVPLDRIRLMKTLFLVWFRNGSPSSGPFHFQPYLYGPCAFDLYSALEKLVVDGLLIQADHPIDRWAPYYLTGTGKARVERLSLSAGLGKQISETALWAASQTFDSLLAQVYREAPEFASKSVFRGEGQVL